jgi:flagellar hook-associated protein 2
VDSAAFTAALQSNPDGVRSVFGLTGSATGTGLEYVAAGSTTPGGSYDVNITAAATTPSVTSTGATFPFNDGGTPSHLTIVDGFSNKSTNITLATGDDASTIAVKLNGVFAAQGMLLQASVVSGALTIASSQYGTSASFTLSYDAGDTTSAAQLGIAAQKYTGTNVAGTINGVAATGLGQTLTSAIGSATEGLVVRYSGTLLGAIGTAKVVVGTGALMSRLASSYTRSGDGLVATNTTQLGTEVTNLQTRSDSVSEKLANRKAALLKQFAAMEAALSTIQNQGNQLTSMITALQPSKS